MRRFSRAIILAVAAMLAGSCASIVTSTAPFDSRAGPSIDEPTTPCEDVVPDCHAKRLPDVVLSESLPKIEGVGSLGPVNESLDGTISFDDALVAAWREDPQAADTVQVVLGTADAQAMHWDASGGLFYGILWNGVCVFPIGGRVPASPRSTGCSKGDWGTIIDARTGAFIVGGTA